jgi:hypothetical protein
MNNKDNVRGVLASLSPDELNSLTGLIISKLAQKNGGCLLPKQDVEGSNPFTRSTKLYDDLPKFNRQS